MAGALPGQDNLFIRAVTFVADAASQMQPLFLLVPCAFAFIDDYLHRSSTSLKTEDFAADYEGRSKDELCARLREREKELDSLKASSVKVPQLDGILRRKSELDKKLSALKEMESRMGEVLSIKCSKFTSREKRRPIQEDLIKIGPPEVRRELKRIFDDDDNRYYCGGQKQWLSLWFGSWESKLEAREYRTVIEMLEKAEKASKTSKKS